MSGVFVNPGVRFSLLFRCLESADRRCLRLGSRRYEAEFPLARLIVYRFLLLFRSWEILGSPTMDRASSDALRPFNNWTKPEDQYGISFIRREKWPASARRRLPQKGRREPLLPERTSACAGKKITPAANHGPFLRRRKARPETGAAGARAEQWFRAAAAGADGTAFASAGIGRSHDAPALRREPVVRRDGERPVRALQRRRRGAERRGRHL